MEVDKPLRDLLCKFPTCSNIIPFLGYLDEVAFVLMNTCKDTKSHWDQFSEIIRTKLMVGNMRGHPFFDNESEPIPKTMQAVKRVFKGQKYILFKLPHISVSPTEQDMRQFDELLTGEYAKKMNFTKFHFGNVYQMDQYSKTIEYLSKNEFIRDNVQTLIQGECFNWQNSGGKAPCLDTIDFRNNNQGYSLDSFVEQLNTIEFPVKKLINGFTSDHDTPEEKINDVLAESVETFRVKYSGYIDEGYAEFSDFLIKSFPNLKKIEYQCNNDYIYILFSTLNKLEVRDIEEFYTCTIYSQSNGFNATISAENVLFYYEKPDDEMLFPACVGKIKAKTSLAPLYYREINGKQHVIFHSSGIVELAGIRQLGDAKEVPKTKEFPAVLDTNTSCIRLCIPVDAITHIDITTQPPDKDKIECITSLPESLEFLSKDTILDIKLTNKTADDSVEKILPRLTDF